MHKNKTKHLPSLSYIFGLTFSCGMTRPGWRLSIITTVHVWTRCDGNVELMALQMEGKTHPSHLVGHL